MSGKQLEVNSTGPKSVKSLSKEDKERLYSQIRGIEHLQAEIDDLNEDKNEQKKLLREEFTIANDVLNFVLQRRKKLDAAERMDFDDTVTLIEEAIEELETRNRLRVVSNSDTKGSDQIPE